MNVNLSDFDAKEIIKALGGIRKTARKLDLAATTVQGWKSRSHIPDKYFAAINAIIEKENINIALSQKTKTSKEEDLMSIDQESKNITEDTEVSSYDKKTKNSAFTLVLFFCGFSFLLFLMILAPYWQNVTNPLLEKIIAFPPKENTQDIYADTLDNLQKTILKTINKLTILEHTFKKDNQNHAQKFSSIEQKIATQKETFDRALQMVDAALQNINRVDATNPEKKHTHDEAALHHVESAIALFQEDLKEYSSTLYHLEKEINILQEEISTPQKPSHNEDDGSLLHAKEDFLEVKHYLIMQHVLFFGANQEMIAMLTKENKQKRLWPRALIETTLSEAQYFYNLYARKNVDDQNIVEKITDKVFHLVQIQKKGKNEESKVLAESTVHLRQLFQEKLYDQLISHLKKLPAQAELLQQVILYKKIHSLQENIYKSFLDTKAS